MPGVPSNVRNDIRWGAGPSVAARRPPFSQKVVTVMLTADSPKATRIGRTRETSATSPARVGPTMPSSPSPALSRPIAWRRLSVVLWSAA
jgi:hypothetical protein